MAVTNGVRFFPTTAIGICTSRRPQMLLTRHKVKRHDITSAPGSCFSWIHLMDWRGMFMRRAMTEEPRHCRSTTSQGKVTLMATRLLRSVNVLDVKAWHANI